MGEFEEDQISGKGEMIDENGNVLIGEFKKGKRHGKGELKNADGRRYLVVYEDGI